MSESDWHKRVESFKRRITSALAKLGTRFGNEPELPRKPARENKPAGNPVFCEQPKDGFQPLQSQRHVTGALTSEPPQLPALHDHDREFIDACRSEIDPAIDQVAKVEPGRDHPVNDGRGLERSGSDSVPDERVDDAPQPAQHEPDPTDESVLALLIPSCSVEAKGIWLPEPYQPPEPAPDPSVLFTAPQHSLLETLPEFDLGVSQRLLAISDSENVVTPVTDTLRYAGVLKKTGELRPKIVRGLQILHTGDMILKHQPDPAVVDYWVNLRERVDLLGGELVLLAGNHELEIWSCLQRGQRLGLKRRQCQRVQSFIRTCRLFHVASSVLFIHGYPTLNLLRCLKDFRERTGLSIDHYNEAHFRPALDDPRKLAHFRYLKGKGSRQFLLHDLENPASYYRTHGREIATLLRHFGIEQVVHGHRPERSGIQADYEFRRWLPGIRMIGNDTQLRQRGLGAVVMRMDSAEEDQVLLVNTTTFGADQRKQVKRALREPRRPEQPRTAAHEVTAQAASTI